LNKPQGVKRMLIRCGSRSSGLNAELTEGRKDFYSTWIWRCRGW